YNRYDVATPYSFQFGGDAASDGSKPIYLGAYLNDDGSVSGTIRADDTFNTDDEDNSPHLFWNEEWAFYAAPVPEVGVEPVQHGSEDGCQEAQVKFTRSGAPTDSPLTVYYTLAGSATGDHAGGKPRRDFDCDQDGSK